MRERLRLCMNVHTPPSVIQISNAFELLFIDGFSLLMLSSLLL